MSDDGPGRPPSFRDRASDDFTGIGGLDIAPGRGALPLGGTAEPCPGPDPNTDPDTVRACLECETAWVGREQWAHCPRCGAELEQFEHAEAADE